MSFSVHDQHVFVPTFAVTWKEDETLFSRDFSDEDEAQAFVAELQTAYLEKMASDLDGNERLLFRSHKSAPEYSPKACFTMFRAIMYPQESLPLFRHNTWQVLSASHTHADFGNDQNEVCFSYHSTSENAVAYIRGARLTSPDVPSKALSWGSLKRKGDADLEWRTSQQSNNSIVVFDGVNTLALCGDAHLSWIHPDFEVFPRGTSRFDIEFDVYFENPNVIFTGNPYTDIQLSNTGNEDRWMNGVGVSSSAEAAEIKERSRWRYVMRLISNKCGELISAGITFQLPDGRYRQFSAKLEDQIALGNLKTEILTYKQGFPSASVDPERGVSYHGNGLDCEWFDPDILLAICTKVFYAYALYIGYKGKVFEYIKRASFEELDNVYFGMSLPDDLQAKLDEHLASYVATLNMFGLPAFTLEQLMAEAEYE